MSSSTANNNSFGIPFSTLFLVMLLPLLSLTANTLIDSMNLAYIFLFSSSLSLADKYKSI